ncbi:MAG: magnesium transporter [Planctomycetes bacterium]|nr:magnesium transporter [Planctomycetota bacterium]
MVAPNLSASLNDPVKNHLRRDFVQLQVDQTVAEALANIRHKQPEGRIIYFYVLDGVGRLQGVLPTRRLLLNPLDTKLADIMVRQVITIPESATVLEACEFFTLHRLLAFPVVDGERRMLGIVDVELYTEELSDIDRREGNEDLFQLIGVHLTESQQATPLIAFRQRFPWLLCNIAGGIVAAFLSGIYRHELGWGEAVLALFIPVVLALAESVSIQSVSLALQTLHGQKPTWRTLLEKLRREATTGAILGAASGLLVALVALIWVQKGAVALCIIGGIGGGITIAAMVGLALPNVLRLLRKDPQVAAGPIALALADMATLLLYFNLARLLLPVG